MDDNRRDARRYLPPALLALVIGAHVVSNLVFIRADQRPSNINELSHVLSAIDFLNNLRNLDDFRAAYLIAFSGYPPGGVIATLFYALFGRVHDTAQISQLVFSVIILVTLYRLGSSLFGRATGVLAAAFLACSPAAVEVSRQFLLEWPLTAMGTAAVYALWRSEGFTQKGWAYAAGALIGAASLCKQSFLIFLAGPLVFAIVLWALAMRSGDGGRMEFKPASRVFKALLATAAVLALTRFIYTPVTRSAIDGWYSATVHVNAHVGLLVMIVTGVTGALVAAIAVLGRGALFNALGAGGLSFLVASIWYLPHGLNNLRQYGDQMRMNVATMNPTSLMNFYYHHLFDYYLGVIGVVMLLPVAIVVVALRIARKPLARHFFHSERLIAKGRWIFILAWLIVPSVAFLFINIQNEMNTVPLMPSMAMVQAAFVSRLFLPYNRRRRADIEAGRRPPATARAIRTGVGAVGALVTAAIVGAGLLTALPFSDGKGGYKPLPMTGGDSVLVAKYFPRKNNTLNYLVPLPDEWHVDEIAKEVVRATATRAPGYLLSMDVNFYFSWNTFWYTFKLMNREIVVETQWDSDKDLLKSGRLYGYDAIVYREPWKEVYAASKNDYMDYENLWETYDHISRRPEGFSAVYREEGRWTLPDGTTAILLLRRDDATAPRITQPSGPGGETTDSAAPEPAETPPTPTGATPRTPPAATP